MPETLYKDVTVLEVEPRDHPTKERWFRVKCEDIKTKQSDYYSYWKKDAIIKVNETYAICYTQSKPDQKGKVYNNIKDMDMIEIDDDGYVTVNKQDTIVNDKPKVQKSYNELRDENQVISMLEIIIDEIKNIKSDFDGLQCHIYGSHNDETQKDN